MTQQRATYLACLHDLSSCLWTVRGTLDHEYEAHGGLVVLRHKDLLKVAVNAPDFHYW